VLHKIRPLSKPDADQFTLDAVVLSEKHRRVAAKLVEEIVVYDYRVGKKAPMDDWVFRVLQKISEEQERWKERCQARIRQLNADIADVEKANGYI
jgi:hypothetical protein